MSFSLEQIRNLLSLRDGAALYRQVFILAGEKVWQKEVLKEILQGYENDSLWVAEQDQVLEGFPFVATKKARSWLGNEKKIVIFDANKDFDPDSFAAISGVVIGGGLFFLLLPAVERWNKVYASPFGKRLIKSINTTPGLTVINKTDEDIKFIPLPSPKPPLLNFSVPFLTADQQNVVEIIEGQSLKDTNTPVVVISDRGRGKSAALGLVAARLLQAGLKNIVVTAPRLSATDIIFKHIAERLPEAELSRGCARLGGGCIQFYSPDQLMTDEINANVLLVDEAAAIPVPLLTGFLDKHAQCVFATTVHGYEGTGRGFTLRFNKVLTEKYPRWIQLKMQTPIRWPENDPLEKWMFRLLCLDADVVETSSLGQIDAGKFKQHAITKKQLVDDQNLLGEVFSLLVLAHYRTRPSDLKSLLDDDDLSLYVTLYKEHVIAVVLVIKEGGFSTSLSTDVYRGKRRPPGNLLAQSLTYHCGIEHAATLNYARIMRIAVHPEFQQQGIGSVLLDFVVANEKQTGIDAIGTSFGMNSLLLNFWKKSQFNIIRIGFTREQTSGEHAAMMLLPLTENGKAIYREAHTRFNRQCTFWFHDILKNIPLKIKNSVQETMSESTELDEFDNNDIHSFTQYTRNYELCIAALNKLVILKKWEINSEVFPDNFRQVLNNKIFKKMSWKEIVNETDLTGKNEARKLFHCAICYFLSR
ncbi:tRNA cytosine(34) acetyltransferase [hydrothermal vent metagenome]|uniref:tRNA cytosine(34) acetyltransferase n=1 Tax=hydrothermal vent metagenome TaxID=652676 RepID=A0A3B0ZZQ7_9ZZZZ